MKNYYVKFVDGTTINLTAEVAANITRAWQGGAQIIEIGGNYIATHQICSISKVGKQAESDLCQIAGIELKDAPRIEQFLSPKKLLT